MIKKIKTRFPELFFVVKLLLLFSVFYFGTHFWIGITSKGNLYSTFCDSYLNYFVWLRMAILKLAGFFCFIAGFKTNIEATTSLRIINGIKVNMVQSCVGFGILSAWAAFIIAYPADLKRKIIWLLGGIATICTINALRIAILLIWVNKTRDINSFSNHHTIFNYTSYLIVLIMVFFYTKEKININSTK